MSKRAKEGTPLSELVRLAKGVCQQAEQECPRTGPGRRPSIPDWAMAALIMVAVLKQRKTKAAQWRFIQQSWKQLQPFFPGVRPPSRSTYYERFRRAYELFQKGVEIQGRQMIDEGIIDARVVAIDKSLIPSKGPVWHRRNRQKGDVPRGVDSDAHWGYGKHHGWVYGYSSEVVVSSGKAGVVAPILASVDPANKKEQVSIPPKLEALPSQTKFILADAGYDSNKVAEKVEWTPQGRRSGQRFLCQQQRRGKQRVPKQDWPRTKSRQRDRQRREERQRYFKTPKARRIYALRRQTIEPFFSWFKDRFDLHHQVHHRGLDNNRTHITAALCCYQLLIRYNFKCGNHNGEIQWILDAL